MKKFYEKPLKPLSLAISRYASPMLLTISGFILSLVSAFLIYRGMLVASSAALVLAGMMDLLDGMVARASGKTSKFGDFFDAMCDRLSEVAVYLAIFLFMPGIWPILTMVVSLLFSYSAARAEVWTIGTKIRYSGLGSRWQRISLLVLGIASGLVVPSLILITALASIGLVMRIALTWRKLK